MSSSLTQNMTFNSLSTLHGVNVCNNFNCCHLVNKHEEIKMTVCKTIRRNITKFLISLDSEVIYSCIALSLWQCAMFLTAHCVHCVSLCPQCILPELGLALQKKHNGMEAVEDCRHNGPVPHLIDQWTVLHAQDSQTFFWTSYFYNLFHLLSVRPEFELDGINSGSWYHCLPIGIYHWLGEGRCIAAVCEVVWCAEVRHGLSGKKMRWHFSQQRWELSDGCVMLRSKTESQVMSWEKD